MCIIFAVPDSSIPFWEESKYNLIAKDKETVKFVTAQLRSTE